MVAGDDGGMAVGEFSKVKVRALAVQNLQGVGEGAGVSIDGGAGGDVNVLLAVLAAETDCLEETVGGRGGEDGCHFFVVLLFDGIGRVWWVWVKVRQDGT